MKWRELPEETRFRVTSSLLGRVLALGEQLRNPLPSHFVECVQDELLANESAIAALEELARGPETPPSR